MGLTNKGSTRDTIIPLLKLCEEFGTAWPFLFSLLGRMMIWTGTDNDEIIAFQRQLHLATSETEQNSPACDGCEKQLRAGMQRFVCKVCVDIYLCDECIADYEIDGRISREVVEDCQAHPFLTVCGGEQGEFSSSSTDLVSLQWLKSVVARGERIGSL
jgi:hypothetical protein